MVEDTKTLARIAEDTAAIRASVERIERGGSPVTSPVASSATDMIRITRPTGLSRFKCHADSEVRNAIAVMLASDESPKVREVHDQLVKSFGASRVPALSSLYRYIQALIAAGQAIIIEK